LNRELGTKPVIPIRLVMFFALTTCTPQNPPASS
jgi:hypothetical protein